MKMRIKSGTTNRDGGSVLLETVMVLPLFLLLIGGIMWFGQLSIDRQKLVIADRYIAWNFGNRHGGSYYDTPTRFFGTTAKYDQVQQIFMLKTEGEWWQYVCGAFTLNAEMPSWTRGWISADAIMKERPLDIPTQSGEFAGRFGPDQTIGGQFSRYVGGHYVVMRRSEQPQDTRDVQPGVDGPVGIDYKYINEEPYPAQ